ncbi:MAG TPA: magnesium transporter [Planctomycetota bacterium]|nr:magnesium transporter [Planctomycetota bacterium]
MMNTLLIPELRELIQDKNVEQLRKFLQGLHPAQAAELIAGLKPEELSWVLEILDDDPEALIFSYLPEDVQYDLAIGAGRPQLAKLVETLTPDDRAEFMRKLPTKIVDEILPLMAQAERNDIRRLLSFEVGTAGYRMTTEYASVPVNLTCGDALAKVRHEAPDKETIYTIYVIDADRHLEGVVGLKDLLLSRPDLPLEKITTKQVVSVRADDPASTAAELAAKYDLLALPVLDDMGRLLGIVTVDDLIDVMEQKATEDILSLGGVSAGALEKSYFENSVGLTVRNRLGWLLLLFVASTFTGNVLLHFDVALARVVELSFFIPLLIGTGGNAGSQTVSTVIRSLALKEITFADWPRVLGREALTGLVLGLLLGIVGSLRALTWIEGNYELALTIGISVVGIVTWANMVAAMVPMLAQRFGLDPTVLSAPMITTAVDATGLLLYFSIAAAFIGKLTEPMAELPAALRERIVSLASEAPPEYSQRLMEIASPPAPADHPQEWIFIAGLAAVLVFMYLAGRKRATSTTPAPA